MKIRKKRPLLLGLGFAIVATVFTLLVAEALLRLVAPQWSDQWKMWRNHPVYTRGLRQNVDNEVVHGHTGEFAFHFSTNGLGLRMDNNPSPLPDPGTRRILVVGDSFAFGYGIGQGQTFSDHLEDLSNLQSSPIEVINAGFASGYTFDTEYLFTREVGVGWQPSDVIVSVCLSNDVDDMGQNIWSTDNGALASITKDNDWVPVWVKKSGLVNLAVKGAWPQIGSLGEPGGSRATESRLVSPCDSDPPRDLSSMAGLTPLSAPAFPEEEVHNWPVEMRIRKLMQAWSYHAAAHSYRLTLLLIPDTREIQRPSSPGSYIAARKARNIFAGAAHDAGVRVIDPAKRMYDHVCSGDDPLYFQRDGHWNAAGHAFIGKLLLEELFGSVK